MSLWKIQNQLRRLWTVAAFGKWAGMPTEETRERPTRATVAMSGDQQEYFQEHVKFTSQAPRVFPNKDHLLRFLEVFAAHGQGIRLEYEGTVYTPQEALAELLALPDGLTTKLQLDTGRKPTTRLQMVMPAGPWDAKRGGVPCIQLSGTVVHEGPLASGEDLGALMDQLRAYTVTPPKSQLLRPGKPIPLWTIVDRATVLDQRTKAAVARRAVIWGAVSSLAVSGILELVKWIATNVPEQTAALLP